MIKYLWLVVVGLVVACGPTDEGENSEGYQRDINTMIVGRKTAFSQNNHPDLDGYEWGGTYYLPLNRISGKLVALQLIWDEGSGVLLAGKQDPSEQMLGNAVDVDLVNPSVHYAKSGFPASFKGGLVSHLSVVPVYLDYEFSIEDKAYVIRESYGDFSLDNKNYQCGDLLIKMPEEHHFYFLNSESGELTAERPDSPVTIASRLAKYNGDHVTETCHRDEGRGELFAGFDVVINDTSISRSQVENNNFNIALDMEVGTAASFDFNKRSANGDQSLSGIQMQDSLAQWAEDDAAMLVKAMRLAAIPKGNSHTEPGLQARVAIHVVPIESGPCDDISSLSDAKNCLITEVSSEDADRKLALIYDELSDELSQFCDKNNDDCHRLEDVLDN